jgi:hypothetical protein
MPPETLASLVIAGVAVLGSLGGMIALTFRVGRLVGRIDSFLQQTTLDNTMIGTRIDQVNARIERHEAWHMNIGRTGSSP